MGILDRFRKRKPDSEFAQLMELQEMLHSAISKDGGIDADELPNGTGQFGFDPRNPIPCRTVLGSMAYLERLHTQDGAKVNAERIGSFGSPTPNSPVDGYKLTGPGGSELGTIFISPYQARISNKAPEGFRLI